MQEFIGFEVGIAEGCPCRRAVVWFGEEARTAQDDHGQTVAMRGKIAQRLGPRLGRAIDVFRTIRHSLGDPGGGIACAGGQGASEGAGGGGEYEGADLGACGGAQQGQRAGDVGVDEILSAVGGDMGFVQCGGMDHAGRALHGPRDRRGIGDRTDDVGGGGGPGVEADCRAARLP